jgi:hypothetical protein
MFTCNFIGWDMALASSKQDPTEAKLRSLKGTGGGERVTAARYGTIHLAL